jgi:hypothetical protein
MALRVTTPITKYGRYYAAGTIIDTPASVEQSLARLLQWETVSDPKPAIGGLRKPQLVQLAEDRGLDVEGLTKSEIVQLLEG